MDTAVLILLIVSVGISIVSLAVSLLMANWIYNVGLENQRLSSVVMALSKEFNTIHVGMGTVIKSLRTLEKATEASVSVCESMLEFMGGRALQFPPQSLRDGDFFSTDDGKIKADNINDFIDKLQKDPQYKDIADDLRAQLEKELAEDDDDDPDAFLKNK